MKKAVGGLMVAAFLAGLIGVTAWKLGLAVAVGIWAAAFLLTAIVTYGVWLLTE